MLENSTALLLVNGLLGGSIVLLGGLLSLFVREPVYRLRLAGVTLLCTVLAIGVAALPGMPRWSPLTSAQQEAVQNVVTLPPPKASGRVEAASATLPSKNVEAVFPAGHELNGSSVGVFSVEDDLSASPTSTSVAPSSAAVSQFSQPVLPPEFVPQLVQVFATGYLVCVAGLFLWWVVGVAHRVGAWDDALLRDVVRIQQRQRDRLRTINCVRAGRYATRVRVDGPLCAQPLSF